MDLYREDILDHYQNPRNFGEMGNPTHRGKDANASCGDMVEMAVRVDDGVIEEVRWKGIGCAISTAAASKLSEWLKGKKYDVVVAMSEDELANTIDFEVNPGREKCKRLPVRVVRKLSKV